MVTQSVPLVRIKIGFQLAAALLFVFAGRRHFIFEKRQQVALRQVVRRQCSKITRAYITPAPEGGGEF
ncbi:hypothetical protein D3C75_969530 [compost metagenome]